MRLWKRKWKILVTDEADSEALNVSDLHCTFEVTKRRGRGGFYAIVRIYNLTAETENKLINEGDRLIIEAGYEGVAKQAVEDGSTEEQLVPLQYGKIFDGKVIWPSRSKDSNTDYVLTLVAIDGDDPLHLNFVAKTVNRGLNQRKIIEEVCQSGDVPTPINTISDGLSEQELPRGKVFFGRPFDYVQNVCRGNSASCYVEDGQLNITRLQDVGSDEALVVTPETGLIGTPQQTQFGAQFRLLLHPAIRMGSFIQLKNSEINEATAMPGQQQMPLDDEWIYQATEVVHRGDTRGDEWYTDVVGISRYGTGALPALLANSNQNPNGV